MLDIIQKIRLHTFYYLKLYINTNYNIIAQSDAQFYTQTYSYSNYYYK